MVVKGLRLHAYQAVHLRPQLVFTLIGRRVFGLSMMCAALLTLLFPAAARHGGPGLAIAARAGLGCFHAVAFPAMTGVLGAWAPPLERTK